MALEIRQSLGLTQQLIMTPQLQQAIKLLQLSRLELLQTITQEMETNPILEEQAVSDADEEFGSDDGNREESPATDDFSEVQVEERARDDVDWESYISEYNTGWAETPHDVGDETPSYENVTASRTNLCDHLTWQLNMSSLSEDQRAIGEHIIGNLNDDGYLEAPLEDIARASGFPEERVAETLAGIQMFDPVGIAARDARESLLIQLRFQNLEGSLAEQIISDHLRELEDKKYDLIAKKLDVSIQEVLAAITVIKGLDPKPGRLYSAEETVYITPDIYVFRVGDDYQIVLNTDGLPKLRINSYYKDILQRRDNVSESAKNYIQEKLKSAAWLIKSIHQRQRTIYRVTESIVKFQRPFFDRGITHLKPLVLRDVAEDIEMHESTVSRVTTNKYVYTPQGIFELKYFFNSSINSGEGDAIASESVKQHIRTLVKSEQPKKPFSDQEIADFLKKRNINVARRTVAKYRESMGILPSRKRKNPY